MKPILVISILLQSLVTMSQKKEAFYVYDNNWNSTSIDSARFLLRTEQLNDTCWQWDYYNFTGPLLKSEQTRDKDGNVLEGQINYYDETGFLDSTGVYKNGKRHGDFYKLRHYKDSLKYSLKYVYKDDLLVEFVELEQKKDSSKRYPDEKESEFPGGVKRWGAYLQKKLEYPDRALRTEIQGEVCIAFMVDAKGKVLNPYVAKSVEYSLDTESIRIIRASGDWDPAFQNGSNVRSYKIQPIHYRLQ